MQLMKADIMQPIKTVLKSVSQDEVISVLHVVAKLAFTSDTVAQKMLTKELLKSLKLLCAQKNPEASLKTLQFTKAPLLHYSFVCNSDNLFLQVQRSALLTVGNLAFCLDNRRILVTSEKLRELLLRLTVAPNPRVNKAAARALAILGLYFFIKFNLYI